MGSCAASDELSRALVPLWQYRAQSLHHVSTLGLIHVFHLVGTSGNVTHGLIIYTCLLQLSESIRNCYKFALDVVRSLGFNQVGKETEHIPQKYDGPVRKSHASESNTLESYYRLSNVNCRLIDDKQRPLPPARIIRLKPAVYRNHLKGGADVISRPMKMLARSNISEYSVTSIIARLLTMQVSNPAIRSRLFKARKLVILPHATDGECRKDYFQIHQNVTKCETFGKFAHLLVRE